MSLLLKRLTGGAAGQGRSPAAPIAFWLCLLLLALACSGTGAVGQEKLTATVPPPPPMVTATFPLPLPSPTTPVLISPTAPAIASPPAPACGNHLCEAGESPASCPSDCAAPPGTSAGAADTMTIVRETEIPGTFFNGNDRASPAAALSHDGQLVVNIQQPGQGNGSGEGRILDLSTGATTVFWKDALVSTGATWLFADPYLVRVSNNVPRGIIVTFPVYFAEADGTQFAPERGHQLLAVVPARGSAEANLAGDNTDFYDPVQIITSWDPKVTAVGWISALDMSADGEIVYAVAPYVKEGRNHVALIQIAVYSMKAQVLDWQAEGGIVYPFAMLTTGEHARTILVKGNARSGGMSSWVFTNDYVSKGGWYPVGGTFSGENAAPRITYDHISSGPSHFYTAGGPVILGSGDYPWVNVQYAPAQSITQLTWKEGDSRTYSFGCGAQAGSATLVGRWSSYDGNHAFFASQGGNIWCDFGADASFRLDAPYGILDTPESYNNYLSADALKILMLNSAGDRSSWRLVLLEVKPPQ